MPRTNVSEIKRRAAIVSVWSALGGGELRHNRGRAFWRKGDGYSINLNAEHGVWFDVVSNEGGDVVALVETVRQCNFRDACNWIADHVGIRLSEHRENEVADSAWAADLQRATWWRMAAVMLCEHALEHPMELVPVGSTPGLLIGVVPEDRPAGL